MIQFISSATGGRSGGGDAPGARRTVEQLLIDTIPVLESFGNAATVHNPDSSRFGKFVMLHFSDSGGLRGVAVKTYLLESTRAVRTMPGERTFHVFYELVRSGDAGLLSACGLSPLPPSRYLSAASFEVPVPRDDAACFATLQVGAPPHHLAAA